MNMEETEYGDKVRNIAHYTVSDEEGFTLPILPIPKSMIITKKIDNRSNSNYFLLFC